MKRIGIICLALVIAMAALGAGYAYYTQNVYVAGSVTTAQFTIPNNIIIIPNPPPDITWNPTDMTFTVWIRGDQNSDGTYTGAYPGFQKELDFSLPIPANGFNMKVVSVTADGNPLSSSAGLEIPGSMLHTALFHMSNSPGAEPNMEVDSTLGAHDALLINNTYSEKMTFTVPQNLDEKVIQGWGSAPAFTVVITLAQINDP